MSLVMQCLRNFQIFTLLRLMKSLQVIRKSRIIQTCVVPCSADATIETLNHRVTNNKLDKEYYSIDEIDLLKRKVIDGGHKFCAIYLPAVLVLKVLCAAHDDLGYNGFPRSYASLKRVFYWEGMKENIRAYCKMYATCALHRSENIIFERIFTLHCYQWTSSVLI